MKAWTKRSVVVDELGRYWLVKSMRYVSGSGVRVHLSRPRMDWFGPLTECYRNHSPLRALS